MTPFWKEERQGYNIYENEQNHFFGEAGPPLIPLWRQGGQGKKKNMNQANMKDLST